MKKGITVDISTLNSCRDAYSSIYYIKLMNLKKEQKALEEKVCFDFPTHVYFLGKADEKGERKTGRH